MCSIYVHCVHQHRIDSVLAGLFYRCGNTITIDHRQSLIADQIRERSTIFQFRKQTECTADTADWFDGHLHKCLRLKTLKTCARSVRRSTVSLNTCGLWTAYFIEEIVSSEDDNELISNIEYAYVCSFAHLVPVLSIHLFARMRE